MAESYRGLTIRIGADTTEVGKAMRVADSAVAHTQSEIRKLGQALKLDPSSVSAASLQVGALAEQAANTASRVRTLNEAMSQVSTGADGEASEIAQLADAWRNVHAEVELVRERYKETTAAVAEQYTELSKLVQKQADAVGAELKSKWTIETNVSEIRKDIEGLPSVFETGMKSDNKFLKQVQDLQREYAQLTTDIQKASVAAADMDSSAASRSAAADLMQALQTRVGAVKEEFDALTDKFTELSGTKFKFANDNTDLKSLTEGLEALHRQGVITADQFVEMSNRYSTLKDEFKSAMGDIQTAKQVAEFTDLKAETAKAEAQLKSFVNQYVGASEELARTKVFAEVSNELGRFAQAAKEAEDRIRTIDVQLEFDPTNAELLAAREKAVADATAAVAAQINVMKAAIANADEEVLALANSDENLGTKAAAASQNLANLKAVLAEADAQVIALTSEKNKLNLAFEQNPVGMIDDEMSYASALDAVEKQLDEATEQQLKYNEAVMAAERQQQVAFEAVGIREMQADIDELGVHMEHVGEKSKDIRPDDAAFMQALNMMAQAAKQVGREIIESANEIDGAFRNLTKTVEASEQQYKALKDAAVEYSQTHVTSAATMLEMEALGGQLGIVTEELEQFGVIASNLDIATNIDAENIALQLGQLKNILGLDIDGVQGFADALVRLGNNMPAQESSIMNVAQRFAAVASTANFSGEEVLAWAAAIASTGQRSEAAATALGNTVSAIEQAIANGSDGVRDFATIAGVSAEQFAETWKADPTEALKMFIEGLHNINESEESAVAALENMGVTGVRQQQTLLGLSQTIGNLDDAIAMSTDAWNGVSDQWGSAGDAANEARKKSEGFSGSLSMLKNNASNLAAALGEGFVPLMDAAAGALSLLTDIVGGMPGPLQTLLVAFGGIATVVPATAAVVNTLAKGFGDFLSKVSGASSIGEVAAKLLGLETATKGAAAATATATAAAEGATAAATGLSGVLGPLLGIVAGLTVISAVASMVADFAEKQETLRTATEGLVTATSAMDSAYASFQAGTEAAGRSVRDLTSDIEAAIGRQAELARSMRDDWADVGNSVATVDALASKIDELTSKATLSAAEQAELRAAVSAFNDKTGEQISVVDATTGKLSENADAVGRLVDAYKATEVQETAYDQYARLVEEQAELEARLAEAQGQLSAASEEASSWFVDMRDSGAAAAGTLNVYAQAVKDAERALESNKQAQADLVDKMGGFEDRVAAVERVLRNSGDSLSNYGDFTDAELTKVVDAYYDASDGSVSAIDRIMRALEELGKVDVSGAETALDGVATAAKEAEEAATSAYDALKAKFDEDNRIAKATYDAEEQQRKNFLDDQLTLLKWALDDEQTNLKRALDAEYEDAKNTYDREYELVKRELDQQYDLKKKELDREADLLKSELDKQYTEYKRQLDRQYSELKSSLDKAYDARKSALDAELSATKATNDELEAELKRQLDSQYDARKAAYDREYNEYKAQNDRTLTELKRNQKAQTDAFKAETDARVAQMKAEYEAKKKYVSDNDGTKEIEERIEALKRLTKAEQESQRQQEHAAKIEKLVAEVNSAKSRKTRAEAQQKLDEAREKAALDRANYERELEIQRLQDQKAAIKEQTDAKKAALDEQRDDAIQAYKDRRAAEQLELEYQLTDEYERRKSAIDAQNAQYKAGLDTRLAAYKQSLDDQSAAFKAHNDAEEAAIKERHAADLAELKEQHAQQLEAVKLANDDQLAARKEANAQALADFKGEQSLELQAYKDANADKLADLKLFHAQQLEAIKQDHEDRLEESKRQHDATIEEQSRQNDADLAQLKQRHDNELAEAKRIQALQLAAAKEADAALKEEVESTKNEVKAKVDEGTGAVGGKVSGLRSQIEGDERALHVAMVKGAGETVSGVGAETDKLPGEVGRGLDGTKRNVTTKMGEIKAAADTGGRETRKAFSDATKDVPSDAENTLERTKTSVKTKMGELRAANDTGGKEARKAFDDGYKGVEEDTENATSAAISKLKSALSAGRPLAQTGGEELRGSVVDGYGPVDDDLRQRTDAAVDASRSSLAGASLEREGRELGKSIVDGIEDGSSDADIVGQNVSVGLVNGMNGVDLWTAAYNIGVSALDAIKSALGIASPSKEAAALGEYVGEGLGIGIMRGTKVAADDARAMAETVLDAADMGDGVGGPTLFDAGGLRTQGDAYLDEYRSVLLAIEDAAIEHATRMERYGSDTYRTLGAAQEALGSIRGATVANDSRMMREQSAMIGKALSEISAGGPTVNVTLKDVTFSNRTDIDYLIDEVERRVNRRVKGSLI